MKSLKKLNSYEWLFLIVLLLYPFRHVNIGLDLWDTGYSYANFTYGLKHMDPMWFFSTYLANVVGHFFSLLPFGDTLIGLNVYTASIVSVMAIIAYFFLRNTLRIPSAFAFIGLFLALNLCWCPTAVLYNYLTYFFMLLCTIFLYKGLAEHKNKFLYLAGLCLGANVLVRFSNAAEAALIVGVWAYCFIETLSDEETKALKWKIFKPAFLKNLWSRIWRTTLWCLAGYMTSLVILLGYIAIRYGIGTYVEAISRLFGMTSEAPSYTPKGMLLSIYYNYKQGLSWIPYLLSTALVAWLACLLVIFCRKKFSGGPKFNYALNTLQTLFVVAAASVSIYLLYQNNMFSTNYHIYASMHQPVILLLIITMILAVLKVLLPGVPKEEKLISGLVVLINFITSIGSNTGLFPSINNTFILMPYFIWQLYKLFKEAKSLTIKKVALPLTPLWLFLGLYLCFLAYQSISFGSTFVFAEATGIVGAEDSVEDNDVLKGTIVPADRAETMAELTAYVNSHGLKGRESITYWGLPALSFYLEMPPSFNAWCDLTSYQPYYMTKDLEQVKARIVARPADKQVYPVIITTTFMATYEGELANTTEVEKWLIIKDFMNEYGYEVAFQNDQFTLYDIP